MGVVSSVTGGGMLGSRERTRRRCSRAGEGVCLGAGRRGAAAARGPAAAEVAGVVDAGGSWPGRRRLVLLRGLEGAEQR